MRHLFGNLCIKLNYFSYFSRCLSSPASVTLVEAHSIPITRKDLDTLRGLNWLNDEIINFYLAMIVERGKENDNWPNVYTMNTFFLKKIQQQGYSMVRRWTRKVDIFSYDIIFGKQCTGRIFWVWNEKIISEICFIQAVYHLDCSNWIVHNCSHTLPCDPSW